MIARNRPERARVCEQCGSERIGIGKSENIRGQPIYPYYCLDCGTVITQYASRAKAKAYIDETRTLLVEVRTATQEKIAMGRLDPSRFEHMKPCEVCGKTGDTERHHWAPSYLFGDEAEEWPQSYLCREHHVRWHQVVTPNMGTLKD